MKQITWLGNTYQNAAGHGVKEIRIHEENEYRILYVAKFQESIYVLHAFVKKTEHTPTKDIALAKQRFSDLMRTRTIK